MASPCTGFFIAAPSAVCVGESFSIGIKVLIEPHFVGGACYTPLLSVRRLYNVSPRGITYMDNVPAEYEGAVLFDGGEGYDGPAEYSFAGASGPYTNDKRPIRRLEGFRFTTPGLHFITVTEKGTGITRDSNAILVTDEEPEERLFWGDIHSQTFFSDGLRSPEELYAFARHESFLDVFGVADHTNMITERQWEYFVAVTNDENDPGRFATIVGQEWTSHKYGHRNIHYRGDGGPFMPSTGHYGDIENVYKAAREHGALVIPHHSANVAMGVDWSLGHDPEVERLAEIYSIWGNSERHADAGNPRPILTSRGEQKGRHVQDALKMGRRYAFTGGGDIHDGRPGDELHHLQKQPAEYCHLRRQGIMGVWAKELTREAIFDALWNRRVYATTNVRMPIRFSVDGHPMGSEFSTSGEVGIALECASEVPVARVDLVRNGEDYLTVEPAEREVNWCCKDTPPEGLTWYYVRVTRDDGEMGWASPVWVNRD